MSEILTEIYAILDSLKNNSLGVIFLGAMGSLMVSAFYKLFIYLAKKFSPSFKKEYKSDELTLEEILSSDNYNAIIIMLIYYTCMLIVFQLFFIGLGIIFILRKHWGDSVWYLVFDTSVAFLVVNELITIYDNIQKLRKWLFQKYKKNCDITN